MACKAAFYRRPSEKKAHCSLTCFRVLNPAQGRRPNVACSLCKARVYRKPREMRANRAVFCSTACRNRAYPLPDGRNLPPPKRGSENPAWKGGVTQFKKKGNYTSVRYVRAPAWARPMARKDGYVMEHRLVMAEWCGFLLTRVEVVHHVDHDPGRNDRSNLELWPDNASHKKAEHGRFVEGAANRYCPEGWARP